MRSGPGAILTSMGQGAEEQWARVTDGTADKAETQLRMVFQKPSEACVHSEERVAGSVEGC